MKVILLQDVRSLGKKDDIVNINDGYARNYILPKKYGIEANAKNLNELKLQKAREEKNAQKLYEEAREFRARLEDGKVTIAIKMGEGGKAFGSVSSKEISQAVKEQMGYDIDKKKIRLDEPVKTAGEHKVPVKLHPRVTAELKVIVEEAN